MMLDYAMAQIKPMPYKVSSRWVFYRLVQAGFISKSHIKQFNYLLSKARKSFYDQWRPDTLTDSIRQADFKGEFHASYRLDLDSIEEQDNYVQAWFEAEAMHQQFEYHTRNYRVSLIPFRGDCSIPLKWELAKKLEKIGQKHNKPIKILYFGDCDKKGLQILEAAVKDVRAWCNTEFDIERVGLTPEQARNFAVPENPEKPGAYQWEALEDDQASKLILESLCKHQKPVSPLLLEKESCLREKVKETFNAILESV